MDRMEQTSRNYLPDPTISSIDLADPLVVLERGQAPDRPMPAFFTAVGTKDPILDDTRRLKAALDRLGVTCEARYYPGEPHAFNALVWRESAKEFWRETHAFLDRFVPGDP
jgi:acetyl esterase